MPRGAKPGAGFPSQALAAAAAEKRARMVAQLATGRKRCPQCCGPDETLPLSEFARARRAPSGYAGWCKSCNNSAARLRRQEAAADQKRQAALALRDAAEASNPALRAVRLVREQIERDRAEAEAWSMWRRGRGPRPLVVPQVDLDAPHGLDEFGVPLAPHGRTKDGKIRRRRDRRLASDREAATTSANLAGQHDGTSPTRKLDGRSR